MDRGCSLVGIRDNPLERRYFVGMAEPVAAHLGRNIRQLREARGMTQQQMSKLADVPRATWANLESGEANPTLAVLHRVATAFQVTLEELVATPRSGVAFYPRGTLPEKARGAAKLYKLLPDAIPGMEIDRMDLPPKTTIAGVPHTPGTREYLTCERGVIVLVAAGERWELGHGDVVAFRGDQKHSYANPGATSAVGYSVVVLARG
jgi:XRE family transcriptional regulator, regulator of sulfur utilization